VSKPQSWNHRQPERESAKDQGRCDGGLERDISGVKDRDKHGVEAAQPIGTATACDTAEARM
jgi:hypothetical protein